MDQNAPAEPASAVAPKTAADKKAKSPHVIVRAAIADVPRLRTRLRVTKDPQEALNHRFRFWSLGVHPGALWAATERELSVASAESLVTLATICAEAGRHDEALSHLDRAEAADPSVLDRHSYVGLLALARHFRPKIAERFAGVIAAAERYRANRGLFHAMISDPAVSVCIVGNSPCEAGRKLGAQIDSHDVVIRFNDFSVRPEHVADYGRKTDVWAHVPRMRDITRRDDQRFRHTIVGGGMYWRSKEGPGYMLDYADSGHSAEEIPQPVFLDLAQQLGSRPSNGLALLYWVILLRGGAQNLSAFGFAMLDQPGGMPLRYFAEIVPRQKLPPHDWAGEWALFARLMQPGEAGITAPAPPASLPNPP